MRDARLRSAPSRGAAALTHVEGVKNNKLILNLSWLQFLFHGGTVHIGNKPEVFLDPLGGSIVVFEYFEVI